tara:strand:- start:11326 stop:11565 length:240 start_codon:yes stop_codon:yes gene_type:complete
MSGNRIDKTKMALMVDNLKVRTQTTHSLSVLTQLNKRTVHRYLKKIEESGHCVIRGLGKVSEFKILNRESVAFDYLEED